MAKKTSILHFSTVCTMAKTVYYFLVLYALWPNSILYPVLYALWQKQYIISQYCMLYGQNSILYPVLYALWQKQYIISLYIPH